MNWLDRIYEALKTATLATVSAIVSMPIGDLLISILGGFFQIIVTVIGAVCAFLAVEHVKKKTRK